MSRPQVTYPQALAIWHHRLDTRRRSNLARIRQVAAAGSHRQVLNESRRPSTVGEGDTRV